MDLTMPVGDSFLNIQVAVLAKTKNGFLFEKDPREFYYFIGGRVKINETSEDAAIRELFEETEFKAKKIVSETIIENFFKLSDNKIVHEILFVYSLEEELIIKKLAPEQIEKQVTDFENMDIRPKILKDYIISGDNKPHIICKEFE